MTAEPDDIDLKLALCVASGLTVEESAVICGVSPGTYYNRTAKNADYFEKWRSFAETVIEKAIAARTAKLKATQTAEDKIVSRLDSALKVTDRLLDHLTDDGASEACDTCGRGNAATVKELLAGQKQITQWVARFAASEAPKRLEIGGSVIHEHVVMLDDTVDSLRSFEQHMKRIQLSPVIDA